MQESVETQKATLTYDALDLEIPGIISDYFTDGVDPDSFDGTALYSRTGEEILGIYLVEFEIMEEPIGGYYKPELLLNSQAIPLNQETIVVGTVVEICPLSNEFVSPSLI